MLYHYTSLTTFALILATNSIKFNRLDLMDDMDESAFGYGESNMEINSFSFASCWTSDALENIALWKMYADLKGVRIGLDEDMFVTHNTEYGISFLEKPYYRELRSETDESIWMPEYMQELFGTKGLLFPKSSLMRFKLADITGKRPDGVVFSLMILNIRKDRTTVAS